MYCKTTFIAALLSFCNLNVHAQSEDSSVGSLQSVVSAQRTVADSLIATVSDDSDLFPDSVIIDSLAPEEKQMPWDERVKLQLSKLAAEAEHAYYNTGICVWDLTADSLLFGYNNQKVMRPASTQKVFTAITALSVLGAKHEFRTRAYYTGTITADSILMGDIYVVGDYDPMYSHSDLKELAQCVKDLGIKKISGKIYGDASMKNKDMYGNGWCWDDVPSSGQPYHCALMLERGKQAPSFSSYSKDLYFNPAEHFVKVLSQDLQSIGIVPADSLRSFIDYEAKEKNVAAKVFYTKARTIEEVLKRMMKNSDNYHAEAVFYKIAHFNTGSHCSWKDGARQVNNVLRKAGVNTSYVEVADGSGVSLYNYTSPNAEVAMLRFAYRTSGIFEYLYPALPIAGVDGTLSSRMKSGNANGNVRAKTGTVEGCSCLCGYVTASNGHHLAFSIMNNGVLKSQTGRNYQDRVCQELAR